jgi:Tripartite tricarboxylate transporter TctB family
MASQVDTETMETRRLQATRGSPGVIRAPQSLAGGLLLVALAALALWLTRDLDQGTLNAMGPAMLPRWLAVGVGLSGLALLAAAFLKDGDRLERWSLRGPVFVIGGIVAFALTIRPFPIGGVATPGLGLLFAGPLAILIGGHATPEARLRDLVILALSLTPFCMVLFGDLLNLPIPVFPQALTSLFPADWSQKAVLRATAGIMAAAAVLVFLATRSRRPASVDVADHSGRI